jgi:hypothetical protein
VLRYLQTLCVCVSPHLNFRMPKPVSEKIVMHIVASDPISASYFLYISHQTVCLYVYHLFLLGNGSVKMLQRQRIQRSNCRTCRLHTAPIVSGSMRLFLRLQMERTQVDPIEIVTPCAVADVWR